MDKCWWGLHQWNQWKDIDKGEVTKRLFGTDDKRTVGNYVIQQRTCKKCNRKELRTITTTL